MREAAVAQAPPLARRVSAAGALSRAAPRIALSVLIVAVAVYLSVETIRQHRLLETRAYDLGWFENVLWNTLHGRFFHCSLVGYSHLSQHTSLILVALVPFYALAPRPETLLVAQAILVALAAWPLFLVARRLLGGEPAALLVSALYLVHPAVGGAAFYDFHELAFAPLLLFLAYHFHLEDRPRAFWTSVALLLLVKEDLSIVVVLLGVSLALGGARRRGLALVVTGVTAYALLQGLVIGHLGGRGQGFAWYFTDMIPEGAGPLALFATLAKHPIRSAAFALSKAKLAYVAKMLAPLLFLPLATLRGAVLLLYGLGLAFFASRPALYTLGFQYAFHVVPEAFLGALVAMAKYWPEARSRGLGVSRRTALTGVALASALFSWRWGMVYPRAHFQGGFRVVRFEETDADRARYRAVQELAASIPEGASVTASENLVPHVARRREVQTSRLVEPQGSSGHPDAFFIFENELPELQRKVPWIADASRYERRGTGGGAALIVRRTPAPAAASASYERRATTRS